MSNYKSMVTLANKMLRRFSAYDWGVALITRLFVGYFFFETGWAKLHDLNGFTMRFMEWGIPYPAFNAALSAYTECIGGLLTMAGLATRVVSVAMVINMAVAVVSVKLKSVAGLNDFVELDEPLYALVYLWLLVRGAGWLSIDFWIKSTMSGFSSMAAASTNRLESQLKPSGIVISR